MDWASLLLMITTAWKVSKYGVFSGHFSVYHVTSEPEHIRENQNSERSDTEHNDRRKHDYKSNRENKKGDDNKKEKKIQNR